MRQSVIQRKISHGVQSASGAAAGSPPLDAYKIYTGHHEELLASISVRQAHADKDMGLMERLRMVLNFLWCPKNNPLPFFSIAIKHAAVARLPSQLN